MEANRAGGVLCQLAPVFPADDEVDVVAVRGTASPTPHVDQPADYNGYSGVHGVIFMSILGTCRRDCDHFRVIYVKKRIKSKNARV